MDFNKTLNINKRFVLIMILVVGIVLISSYSYALFQVNFIKSNVVILKSASNLNITTTIDSTSSDTFTLPANGNKTVTVHLTTNGITSAMAYKMYYEVTNGYGTFTVTSTEEFTDNKVEGVMQPYLRETTNTKITGKVLNLTFTNSSSNTLTITLGAIGGLEVEGATLNGQDELVLNTNIVISPPPQQTISNAIMEVINTKETQGTTTYITKKNSSNQDIYYLSGDSTTINFNYVSYAGYIWRITAIYPDGTMKLITDQPLSTQMVFDTRESVRYYTDVSNNSSIYQYLNTTFKNTLTNYQDYIVTDGTKQWDITNRENSPSTIVGVSSNNNQNIVANNTNNVIKDKSSSKVLSLAGIIEPEEYDSTDILVSTSVSSIGLLNSYEYDFSYNLTTYSSGYLRLSSYSWWLINNHNNINRKLVYNSGAKGFNGQNVDLYVRPSIYLKLGITYSSGDGLLGSPYVISVS